MPLTEDEERCLDFEHHASKLKWRAVLVLIEIRQELGVTLPAPEVACGGLTSSFDDAHLVVPVIRVLPHITFPANTPGFNEFDVAEVQDFNLHGLAP